MAGQQRKSRDSHRGPVKAFGGGWTAHVRVTHKSGIAPIPLGEGFAIFPRFEVAAEVTDEDWGTIRVSFPVEVTDGRALVKQVTVGTDRPTGIGYNVLKSVPVRDLLAQSCREVMWRVSFSTGETARLKELESEDPAASEVIRKLVGWRKR